MGFDLVRVRNNHVLIDLHLKNVLEKYQIDCVLDVGANIGQYGDSLRALGLKGGLFPSSRSSNVEELTQRPRMMRNGYVITAR